MYVFCPLWRMKAVNYTSARSNLAKIMDAVNDDRAPVLITRQNGAPVLMLRRFPVDRYVGAAATFAL